MRSADIATLLRIPLLLLVIYTIIVRYNPIIIFFLLFSLFTSDTADGYLASSGKHTVLDFLNYWFSGFRETRRKRRHWKNIPKYAGYLDVAVDRIVEYGLWLTFTALNLLPLFVIVVVFVRNTLEDLFITIMDKSYPKAQSAIGKILSSPISRGSYATLKFINFGYLTLVFVSGWPLGIAYFLTGVVVAFSLLRGTTELYEALL